MKKERDCFLCKYIDCGYTLEQPHHRVQTIYVLEQKIRK